MPEAKDTMGRDTAMDTLVVDMLGQDTEEAVTALEPKGVLYGHHPTGNQQWKISTPSDIGLPTRSCGASAQTLTRHARDRNRS